ncbi:transmembrane protein, putative (macronuclear) [Tetrahymena thermophila SB210]|uniref:Transmembrane protein, putative n=1 Tax=Tetrahymena thermophila (strain SB210) TaxID=312017 RepID=I7MAC4_TETTS|nr:transmembrane protein, putative [Tetrahymena thermophila SB210]EAS04316.2 transmembrane protein, putative [Tetrahymena thermophila SB210]|eukprot:XP_001024561.2 transmembrane protein, putative [Tetrahymena thermophila SB210]
MINWVKQIDLFCKPITLNINGNTVYKTFLGGISTVFVSVLLIVFFYNTINEFANKQNMTNTSSTFFNDDPPFINLNSQNMMFAVSIQQDNFITNPYYDIQITYYNNSRDHQGNVKPNKKSFPLEPCTLDHWMQLPKDYDWETKFTQMNFTNWLCPKIDYEMVLGGVYTSNIFSYYKIQVVDCVDNPAINKKCRSTQEIDSFLKYNDGAIRFQLYQSNNIVNPDQQNPVKSYLSDVTQFLFSPKQLYVTCNLFYSQTTLNINENIWVGSNIKTTLIPYFAQDETVTQYIPAETSAYASFFLRKSMFQNTVNRQYQQVDALISYIGGFAQAVVILGSFIIGFFNEREFQIELANKLYDFEMKNKHDNEQNNRNQLIQQNLRSSSRNGTQIEGKQIREYIKNTASRKRRNAVILNEDDPIIDQLKHIHPDQSTPSEQETPLELQNQNQLKNEINQIKQEDQEQQQDSKIENQTNENVPSLIMFDNNTKKKQKLKIIIEEDSIQEQLSDQFNIKQDFSAQNNKLIKSLQLQTNTVINSQAVTSDNDNFQFSSKKILFDQPNSNKLSHNQIELMEVDQQQGFNNQDAIKFRQSKELDQVAYNQDQLEKKQAIKTISNFIWKKKQKQEKNNNYNNQGNLENQDQDNKETQSNSENIGGKFNFKSRRSFLVNQFQELISRQNKIQIDIKYYLNKLLCGKYFKSEENALIDRAQQEINKDLDVFYMIERIKEVEKMKKVLFDKEQQILFNFCPKPIIKLKDDNTLMTRAQLQNKVQSSTQLHKQQSMPKRKRSLFTSGKLLQNTIQAVNQFKKGLKKNEFVEMNMYKYLFEAYDTIMQLDPKLLKRKNKSLINQLGEEMRDIFKTSKLVNFENKSPLKTNTRSLQRDIDNYYQENEDNQSQKNQFEQPFQNQIQEINQQNNLDQKKGFGRRLKKQKTFNEIELNDSLDEVDKDFNQKQNCIEEGVSDQEEEDDDNQEEHKSEMENQNKKELIRFSSDTLSVYSIDNKKPPQNQQDKIDELFTNRVSIQGIKNEDNNNNNFDNAQILVTEEPQIQTQNSEASFNQYKDYYSHNEHINTIFSPKQDEDHPFQKNKAQGNIFQIGQQNAKNQEQPDNSTEKN